MLQWFVFCDIYPFTFMHSVNLLPILVSILLYINCGIWTSFYMMLKCMSTMSCTCICIENLIINLNDAFPAFQVYSLLLLLIIIFLQILFCKINYLCLLFFSVHSQLTRPKTTSTGSMAPPISSSTANKQLKKQPHWTLHLPQTLRPTEADSFTKTRWEEKENRLNIFYTHKEFLDVPSEKSSKGAVSMHFTEASFQNSDRVFVKPKKDKFEKELFLFLVLCFHNHFH